MIVQALSKTTLTGSARLGAFMALHERAAERRAGKAEIDRRSLVTWLLRQFPNDVPGATGGAGSVAAGEWLLHSLPHLGSATTLLFLGTQQTSAPRREANHLLERLCSTVRAEDAILRLDDVTFVVLTEALAAGSAGSLLTRLSWRLWPSDPAAVATGYSVWRPGQDIEGVIAAGRLALFAALGSPQKSGTVSGQRDSCRTAAALTSAADPLSPPRVASYADLRRRALEIEPWCETLPGFDGEQALRLAVEAQEEDEFGHKGHGLGVARISEGLAAAMGLKADQLDQLRKAALLHDGGKIALDRALWGGRGTITAWQRKLMEAHASFGSELADHVGVSDATVMAILHHHERWDGGGYPAKLQGDLIPVMARILFVAEVVDSMLRPSYRRQPMTPKQVAGVLEAGAGNIWDPHVARHAARMMRGSP